MYKLKYYIFSQYAYSFGRIFPWIKAGWIRIHLQSMWQEVARKWRLLTKQEWTHIVSHKLQCNVQCQICVLSPQCISNIHISYFLFFFRLLYHQSVSIAIYNTNLSETLILQQCTNCYTYVTFLRLSYRCSVSIAFSNWSFSTRISTARLNLPSCS